MIIGKATRRGRTSQPESERSLLGGSGELGLSELSAVVSLGEEEFAALLEGVEAGHLLGELHELRSGSSLGRKSKDGGLGVLLGGLNLGISGVVDLTLLRLALLSGEEDELALVSGEAGNVQGLTLLGLVLSSVVNSDTNRSSESRSETSSSHLSEGEASAESLLAAVSLGHRSDDGAQLTERTRINVGLLSGSSLRSKLLVSRLVEVASDSTLPVLSEMSTVKHVIVF